MYSLYRAWFGSEESFPRLETLSPPDTVVRVGNEGEHQFVAHRGVLAAHSGYLKALLGTASTSSSSGGNDSSPSITSVSVSSIGGEAFAPLLNYMYTGRLEVTLDNIYSVLLATHLLHMPGALEQCRAALLRLRAPSHVPALSPSSSRNGNILRPVPNRLIGPPLCWPQASLYPSLPHLSDLQIPSALSVIPTPILPDPANPTLSYRESTTSPVQLSRERLSRSATPEAGSALPHGQEQSASAKTGTDLSKNHEAPHRGSNCSPSPSESSEKISVTDVDYSSTRPSGRSRSQNEAGSSNGVIYDVACCDGPVRFQRVLNENYSGPPIPSATTQTRPRLCEEVFNENDENGHPDMNTDSSSDSRTAASSACANGNFTCTYCKHTFKSQYCYRKHARRHLLPTEIQAEGNRVDGRRREVRLLDLNVQYYPCKICGSKFPSYYFVHKHRKLCHSNVEDTSQRGTMEEPARTEDSNFADQ